MPPVFGHSGALVLANRSLYCGQEFTGGEMNSGGFAPYRVLVAILALLALLAVPTFAQTEAGSISGTVTDSTGAVVPGATVTVKSTATGATRTATTNNTGLYNVTNLQPGTYDLTVEGKGFAAAKRTVAISVGSRSTVDIPLSATS